MIKRLSALRRGGHTRRFHTERFIGEETVGQHSFGVACIITLIEDKPSAELLMAALFHDIAEQDTGDIPAPVKWAHPDLKILLQSIEDLFHHRHDQQLSPNLSAREHVALKWADSLDLLCTAIEQVELGNRNMCKVVMRIVSFLHNYEPHFKGLELLKKLEEYYVNSEQR